MPAKQKPAPTFSESHYARIVASVSNGKRTEYRNVLTDAGLDVSTMDAMRTSVDIGYGMALIVERGTVFNADIERVLSIYENTRTSIAGCGFRSPLLDVALGADTLATDTPEVDMDNFDLWSDDAVMSDFDDSRFRFIFEGNS